MSKDVKQYIKESIQMWEEIRDNGYVDKEAAFSVKPYPQNSCYICQYVLDTYGDIDCSECPIKWGSALQLNSGEAYCEEYDSPYNGWERIAGDIKDYIITNYIDAEYDAAANKLYEYADEVVDLLKEEYDCIE